MLDLRPLEMRARGGMVWTDGEKTIDAGHGYGNL